MIKNAGSNLIVSLFVVFICPIIIECKITRGLRFEVSNLDSFHQQLKAKYGIVLMLQSQYSRVRAPYNLFSKLKTYLNA